MDATVRAKDSPHAGSRPEPAPAASPSTRSLLRYGVIAGPFYLAVGLALAVARDGFDLARHPLSLLANGPGGWIQTANFVLTGTMVIAAAVGIGRPLGATSRLLPWALGGFGFSMILAAIFPADPVDGFPPGTPEGFPTAISTIGLLHFAAGALGFACLAVSCFLAARAMSRAGGRTVARLSLAAGVVVVLGFFGGMLIPGFAPGILGIWASVVVGWIWLAAISLHLGRLGRTPASPP